MKRRIPLTEFVSRHGQAHAAECMRVTPSAVWQMLRDNREVYLESTPDGWKAFEVRPVKHRKGAAA